MKKFVFSLQVVYDQELRNEDQALDELRKLRDILDLAYYKRAQAIAKIQDVNAKKSMRTDMSIEEYRDYENFINEMLDVKMRLNEDIARLKRQEEIKLAAIAEIKKRIKTLDNLRDRQYEEYLEQDRKEQQKVLDELVSLQSVKA